MGATPSASPAASSLSVGELKRALTALDAPPSRLAACVERQEFEALYTELSAQAETTDAAADSSFECAICWMETEGSPAALPCCGAPPAGSSTVYCMRCLEIICETALGGMGRCPTCRGYIQKRPGGGLDVADGVFECDVCHQARPIVEHVHGRPICGACSIGIRAPLRYECERCRRVQRIPHPMYRYQVDGPGSFGNNSWFCNGGVCNDFTHWRVHPADVQRVPAEDCPESWGRRDEWLARVREQRLNEAANGGPAPGAVPVVGGGGGGRGAAPRELLVFLVIVGGLVLNALWDRTVG